MHIKELTIHKNRFQITFSKTGNKFELEKVIWLGNGKVITDIVFFFDMEDMFLDEIREQYENDNTKESWNS